MNLTKFFQAVTEFTREVSKYTVLNISVINKIGNVLGNVLRHFKVLRICLYILPKGFFSSSICRGRQNRWVWIPFIRTKVIIVRLLSQKVSIENMTELVCKHTENYLVSVFASLCLGNERMSRVNLNGHIIGSSKETVFRVPVNINTNTPVIMIPTCLCSCQVFKVSRK